MKTKEEIIAVIEKIKSLNIALSVADYEAVLHYLKLSTINPMKIDEERFMNCFYNHFQETMFAKRNLNIVFDEYNSTLEDHQVLQPLPSDDEIESLSVKRYRGEDLDEQKRNSKLILAFEDGLKQMRSIASPLLASHVARILELEEAGNQILKWYDDENDSKANSTEQWQKAYNQLRKALTPPKP